LLDLKKFGLRTFFQFFLSTLERRNSGLNIGNKFLSTYRPSGRFGSAYFSRGRSY
jgi:hypothetical protein